VGVGAALLAATLAAAGAPANGYEGGVRASSGTRTVRADGREVTVGEITVLPRVSATFDRPRFQLRLGYAPDLRITRTLGPGEAERVLAHGATAAAEWDASPRWRIAAGAHGVLGTVDLLARGAEGEGVETLPRETVLRHVDGGAVLSATALAAPRWTASATLRAGASGGLDATARGWLPLQRQLDAAGHLLCDAGPRDALRVESGATTVDVVSKSAVRLARGAATWLHRVTPGLEVRAGGGAVVAERAGAAGTGTRVVALADAGARWEGDVGRSRVDASGTVRVAPVVDRVTGAFEQRLEVGAEIGVRPPGRLSFGGRGAGVAVTDREDVALGKVEVHAGWQVSPSATLFAGTWGQWQRDPRVSADPLLYWGAAIGVDVVAFRPERR
jgi:hypothetical protein